MGQPCRTSGTGQYQYMRARWVCPTGLRSQRRWGIGAKLRPSRKSLCLGDLGEADPYGRFPCEDLSLTPKLVIKQ